MLLYALNAECEHFLWRVGRREQAFGGFVDAHICGLGGQGDGDDKCVRGGEVQLGVRIGPVFGQRCVERCRFVHVEDGAASLLAAPDRFLGGGGFRHGGLLRGERRVAKAHFAIWPPDSKIKAMTDQSETIYLETELRPNASLSQPAFLIVMGLVGVFSFAAGIMYLLAGAWPVFGFFGLDAALIYGAFKLSFRSQQQVTYVRVDATHVRLWHMQRGKPDKKADLPTAFVRVALDEPVDHNSFLTLQYGPKAWVIGRFLTPKRRKAVAKELRDAIRAARQHNYAH